MPKKKANIPPNETPAQRFTRVGSQRVTNILRNLNNLGKLRGKLYVSTPEQRTKIQAAIDSAFKQAMTMLNTTGAVQDEGFKL